MANLESAQQTAAYVGSDIGGKTNRPDTPMHVHDLLLLDSQQTTNPMQKAVFAEKHPAHTDKEMSAVDESHPKNADKAKESSHAPRLDNFNAHARVDHYRQTDVPELSASGRPSLASPNDGELVAKVWGVDQDLSKISEEGRNNLIKSLVDAKSEATKLNDPSFEKVTDDFVKAIQSNDAPESLEQKRQAFLAAAAKYTSNIPELEAKMWGVDDTQDRNSVIKSLQAAQDQAKKFSDKDPSFDKATSEFLTAVQNNDTADALEGKRQAFLAAAAKHTSIVDLRTYGDPEMKSENRQKNDAEMIAERTTCERMGIHYDNFPMNSKEFQSPQYVSGIVQSIDERLQAGNKVDVHCFHGTVQVW
jgi:hypothetical protein